MARRRWLRADINEQLLTGTLNLNTNKQTNYTVRSNYKIFKMAAKSHFVPKFQILISHLFLDRLKQNRHQYICFDHFFRLNVLLLNIAFSFNVCMLFSRRHSSILSRETQDNKATKKNGSRMARHLRILVQKNRLD